MDVSIVIPAYNALWSLPRAIQSCRNTNCQTEIIVVDDGSTDGTWQWLQTQTDVKTLHQPNQGQTYAINAGVAMATGRYIRFLDSDDFLCEGIIDAQFNKAEEDNAELVYSRVDFFNKENGKYTVHPDIIPWNDFIEVQLSNRYGSHFLGMLFKTELVNAVPRRPDFAYREDRMFLLEYALLKPKISFVNGCAGYWVSHKNQMQANYFRWKGQVVNWQHLNIYKRVLAELEQRNELTVSRKKAACTVLWPLAHWIAKDFLQEAIEVVEWIYRLDPEFKIPEKGMLGYFYNKLNFKNTEKLLRLRRLLVR